MKSTISIQIKVALLLIVFSLNTLIGFACAVGINMGFNSSDNHDEQATEINAETHADTKKDSHQKAKKHNDEQDSKQKQKSNNCKGDCCNDKVIKFNDVDKSASHSLSPAINPVFFTTFIASFHSVSIFYTSFISTSIKYFVRSYHPPISDIRIAIQSFLI